MAILLKLKGQQFGRLTVIEQLKSDPKKGRMWLCLCACGKTKEVCSAYLRSGDTKSCGCLEYENQRFGSILHGKAKGTMRAPEYTAWASAKGRCYNPKNKKYPAYGGRGVKMCERWRDDFGEFYKDMGPRPKGHTLDRINVDGDYEPTNCRWATWEVQRRNRQKQVLFNGVTLPLKEVAKQTKRKYKSLHHFFHKRGMMIEQAIEKATPL